MFVIKEAAGRGEGLLEPRFESAADAHYYLLRYLRRRYRHRGYDAATQVYWGSEGDEKTATRFSVRRQPHPAGETGH